MWSQTVWGICIALEIFLLLRAAKTRLLNRFPTFYAYISFVLLVDLVAIPIFKLMPNVYVLFYWLSALLKAVLGYGVIVEIYKLSLKNYLGLARLIKILLLIVFIGVTVKVGISLFNKSGILLPYVMAGMERNLRQVQAILLFCLLTLFVYYKIPTDKNMRGLMLGYSLFIGVDVISFTFITHPSTGFAVLMRNIDPIVYGVALIIWCEALWSPSPELVLQGTHGIERDYDYIAQRTRLLLLRARMHLLKVARP